MESIYGSVLLVNGFFPLSFAPLENVAPKNEKRLENDMLHSILPFTPRCLLRWASAPGWPSGPKRDEPWWHGCWQPPNGECRPKTSERPGFFWLSIVRLAVHIFFVVEELLQISVRQYLLEVCWKIVFGNHWFFRLDPHQLVTITLQKCVLSIIQKKGRILEIKYNYNKHEHIFQSIT